MAASVCQHEDTAATVAGKESCEGSLLSAVALLPGDLLRAVSSSAGHYTVPVPRYQFARPTIDVRFDIEPAHGSALENRPIETTLRI
jgi:hypothetical protein